jgi:uncharacterized protein (DUF1778 family)
MASFVESACLKMDIAMSVQAGSQLDLLDLENLLNTTTIKENRLNMIRCNNHARKMVNKAAAYAHVSISEFVLSHALSSAERVIQEHELITLQPANFQAFPAALDEPVVPNATLYRAFNRYSEQVKR